MVFFRILSCVVICASLFGVSTAADANSVVATVNGTPIYEQDLNRELLDAALTVKGAPVSQEARVNALRHLLTEVAASKLFAGAITADPALRGEIEHRNNQLLLEAYDSSKIGAIDLTPREIDEFIAAHPQYFSARRTYHYAQAQVTMLDKALGDDLQRHIADLRQFASLSPNQLQANLGWARQPAYSISVSRKWLGAEQIAKDTLDTLVKLEKSGRKVDINCTDTTCSILALQESYGDPVDPELSRSVIAAQLMQMKWATAQEKVNDDLLSHQQIHINDTALNQAFAKANGAAVQEKMSFAQRFIWAAQIFSIVIAIACGIWIFRKDRGKYRTPSYLAVFSYERYVRYTIAVLFPAVIVMLGLRVLLLHPIADASHDVPMIVAMAAIALIAAGTTFRFVAAVRQFLFRRRYSVLFLIAAQTALVMAG